MNTPQQVPQAVLDALQRGDTIGAIKRLREASGGDLKSVLALVQRIAAQAQAQTQTQTGEAAARQLAKHAHEPQSMRESHQRTQEVMHGKRTPTVMPGDGGNRGMVWLLLGIVAAAAWFFFLR